MNDHKIRNIFEAKLFANNTQINRKIHASIIIFLSSFQKYIKVHKAGFERATIY